MSSITFIVPTIGRPTLDRTLKSLASQLDDSDHVLTISDNNRADNATMHTAMQRGSLGLWSYAYTGQQLGNWGHSARNIALSRFVRTSHWATIDDDDIYLPGAVAAIKAAITTHPDNWHVFGMRFGAKHPLNGLTLPRGRGLMHGEIGTPMIVAPTCKSRFAESYDGDYHIAIALHAEFGEAVWHEEVIAEIRP